MAQLINNAPPHPPLLRIEPFKGVNYSVTQTQISQTQSPDMMNMTIDERGALNKRTGYTPVIPPLGEGNINGMFLFRKKDGSEVFLFAHGTKLYMTDEIPNKKNTRLSTWADEDLTITWESEV